MGILPGTDTKYGFRCDLDAVLWVDHVDIRHPRVSVLHINQPPCKWSRHHDVHPPARLQAWPVIGRLERPIAPLRKVRQSPAPVIPFFHEFLTQSEVVDFVRNPAAPKQYFGIRREVLRRARSPSWSRTIKQRIPALFVIRHVHHETAVQLCHKLPRRAQPCRSRSSSADAAPAA